MLKRALNFALICLLVVPVNTYAADGAEIDSLVNGSKAQAQEIVKEKLLENQMIVAEITKLEAQIKELQESQGEHNSTMKKDLYIAGGTALATAIAMYAFRGGKAEMSIELNYMFKIVALIVGGSYTVKKAVAGGYNYYLVSLDQEKLAPLQEKLQELKVELEKNSAELLK